MTQSGNALSKLLDLASDDRSMIKLVELAIQRLEYRNSERVATTLLMTILANEELSERIATGFMPISCPNCRGREGTHVYVPMNRARS